MSEQNLLEVKDLVIHYETDDGLVEALNGVSVNIPVGKTLGLVGETGAGKTTLAKGIMRLIPSPPGKIKGGEVWYNGKNLLDISEDEMKKIRGEHISMIFQDPMTSLNPVMTVGDQIMEVILEHNEISQSDAKEKAKEMLELVGIPGSRFGEYPHQFSGGMKQRVIIAIALACKPKLLIADEPTTALDVTIQAQILDLIRDLNERLNTSVLFITHDLGVVNELCDTVIVMYTGRIVEKAPVSELFSDPKHPYTIGLMDAIPRITKDRPPLKAIEGSVPNPTEKIEGCSFWPRCPYATEQCKKEEPPVIALSEDRLVKCWRYDSDN